MRRLLIATSLVLYLSTTVSADIVFSNFGDEESFPNAGRAVGAFPPDNFTDAMPFAVSQDIYLDEVKVAVTHFSEFPPNSLNVAVYTSGDDGEPGSPLDNMKIVDAPLWPSIAVQTGISSLHPKLIAGEDYWMVLSSEGQFGWAFTPLGQSGFKFSTDGGATWQDRNLVPSADTRSVFSVAGRFVPEPPTIGLLAVLLFGFGAVPESRFSHRNTRKR